MIDVKLIAIEEEKAAPLIAQYQVERDFYLGLKSGEKKQRLAQQGSPIEKNVSVIMEGIELVGVLKSIHFVLGLVYEDWFSVEFSITTDL